MFSRSEAINLMNGWGSEGIPFLFIVDFEMKAIRLFRLDLPLPDGIQYDFQGEHKSCTSTGNISCLAFQKNPVTFDEYQKSFTAIRKEIAAGNSFLANLTFPTSIETNLSLRDIFENSRARYKLLVDGEFVCFSPEAFVKIKNGTISTFPMKGTINASLPDAERLILTDPKESAEHNTVVDLLRNDISMVAGDVTLGRYRYIDRLTTHEGEMLQVSSEIRGSIPLDYQSHLGDIIFTLLPAGSVTGAPKEKTTALIRKVENADRGFYTGICGVFNGTDVDSAVMIRFIELHNGKMRFRSGGGITFLSNAFAEYNELIDKVYVPIS